MGEEVQEVIIQINDQPFPTILDLHTLYKSSTLIRGATYKYTKPSQNLQLPNLLESPIGEIIVSIEGRGDNAEPDNPQDAWLPITASRNGSAYYAAFHSLNSGIGFQALMLPVAFSVLGWTWGIISLSMAFVWQYYTKWLLIQLHESVPGTRFNRYLHLSMAAFGARTGKLLGLFPIMYLSGGACVMLILNGGAITAVLYCILLWAIPLSKSRLIGISYDSVKPKLDIAGGFDTFAALGIIAFAFRGHNLVLEIQATLPSSENYPSHVPMMRAVNFAYLVIALCVLPLAVAGYWAYGDKIPANGMLTALHTLHEHDTSKFLLGLTSLLVVIHSLTAFQIYAMPAFDNLEFVYTSKKMKPCSRWIRAGFRIFFGCLTFFIAVAIPFIRNLTGVIGGIALPVTLAYPCFMWIAIKKPERFSALWCFNLVLGSLGVILSIFVFAGGIKSLVEPGIDVRFFKP
ncbi:hypothetical protein IFM89_021810 [Coptis chinensis]|uniref:Amino acid transporter transmembrane domain-containing protein n=1 Tax=Coptis chinensis TaxID=261450 RepID=A0A835MF53_9MAGN|nr:hypothetical protein IFM89_021810 [Coptis chinensis]